MSANREDNRHQNWEKVIQKTPETGRFSKKNREAIQRKLGNRREGSGA
jgi:hypothetical protein